ncbi:MAG: gspG [Candidatus Nomurabacteria bacterium]|nr:gspG [Candidatus Nomurabacteria bacterium]
MFKISKKSFKGFTLIELLVVIAIIGLLSTVIAAPITESRRKGRDAKKIADLRSISTAIQLYADDNAGEYPPDISSLVPRYLQSLPANAWSSASARDKYMYTVFADPGANNRRIGYHLGVKLESANQALNDDADCGGAFDFAMGGSSKPCVNQTTGAIPYTCIIACTASNPTWVVGDAGYPPASSINSDFGGGQDTGTTACTSVLVSTPAACIYDLTN